MSHAETLPKAPATVGLAALSRAGNANGPANAGQGPDRLHNQDLTARPEAAHQLVSMEVMPDQAQLSLELRDPSLQDAGPRGRGS